MNAAQRKARDFLEHETAFRLGVLPTEQPHPKTVGLAEKLGEDTCAGVRMLQSVDLDLLPVLEGAIDGAAFRAMVDAMSETLQRGGRIFFTGCGATGRLSILLEAMWRRFWRGQPAANAAVRADQVRSVMAGGDFALIRSVEGFEDFQLFGRRQLRETGVAAGDTVVAITEGGETSFVIGTAWEAVDVGARAFFVFNNPADVLTQHVERSGQVIADERIVKIDLATGPMAVAGSTRMQATTLELIVVGLALEAALASLLDAPAARLPDASDAGASFRGLLEALAADENVSTIADLVKTEEAVYRQHGLVTYFADECLLDVLTDTTERSPTFSLPPFRELQNHDAARSWSFVKTPLHCTPDAWRSMLGRPPRGVDWQRETYREMDAPSGLVLDPPVLDAKRILSFGIGNEKDDSRTEAPATLALALLAGAEVQHHLETHSPFRFGFRAHAARYRRAMVLTVGPQGPPPGTPWPALAVRCDWPATRLDLWPRVATKLVLNTVSTATMGRVGRLVSNWMVYVSTSNKKLIDRGVRLIAEQAGVGYEQACEELFATLQEMPPLLAGSRAESPVAATIRRLSTAAQSAGKGQEIHG